MAVAHTGEMMVTSGDARICVDAFGTPEDPAVLLLGGAASSMDAWEEDFCVRLATFGRYVIRYDNRDTGRSTSYPMGHPGYGATDMVADAIAVLDGLNVNEANLFGVSMGGAIAQVVAVKHPDRVAGLVLQSTTPALERAEGTPELPFMDSRLAESWSAASSAPDWSTRESAIVSMVESERQLAGRALFDAERQRRIAGRTYDRSADMAAMQANHMLVVGGEVSYGSMRDIGVPTLVLHGTEDPLLPHSHGEALAAEIRGARLVTLPGMGHQYPPEPLWDLMIGEVAAHTGP